MMNEFGNISNSENWNTIELVNKGWSDDIKYHITTYDNRQLLLRISDISAYISKKREYEVMKMLDSCDILMSRPLDFGICNNGKSVFILLTWIDGIDAEVVLSTLSAEEQYTLGYNAGIMLQKIHQIPAPENQEGWADRFNKKIDHKIKNYKACAIKIEKADMIIDYINKN